jgi:hypothetical protein
MAVDPGVTDSCRLIPKIVFRTGIAGYSVTLKNELQGK